MLVTKLKRYNLPHGDGSYAQIPMLYCLQLYISSLNLHGRSKDSS